MKLSNNILQPYLGDLVGFSGERVPVLGSVWLQTTLGEQPLYKTQDIQYLVVDCFSPYNVILGRPFLNRFAAIVSTVHLCVKFPVQDNVVATVHGDLQEARQCYNTSLKPIKKTGQSQINSIKSENIVPAELDPRADFEDRPMPNEELTKISLTGDPMKFTFVGTSMSTEERKSLESFLRQNADLFAWTSADMPGIDPSVITHKLNINPAARPGATYQRLMNKIFEQQIGRNIEVYVDDMVAKTKLGDPHIQDLAEIFEQIRRYKMRLNPEKCAFGVQGGKFLGFILTSRGIEANPEKCQAILDMKSPSTIKEVQRLTGRLAALSRFLPCLAPKSLNFFQCLKKSAKHFEWNQNCEMAFTNLKEILSKPPVLQKPKLGKPLYIYLSITDSAISSALVIETDKNQQPVYFVSKSLQNAELCYPTLEKVALALVFSSRRLRPYFQSHTIIVKTGQPLRQVLSKPELAGRLIKWAIELSEFDIQYQPRGSIKSQHLIDFVAELTEPCSVTPSPKWSLFVDGASNPHGAGAGMLLKNSEGIALEHSLRFSFKASNNQGEYEALIAGLRLAADLHVDNLKVYCDSLLVVQQVNHSFQTKDPILLKYLDIVQQLLKDFSKIEVIHIPREQNHRADVLSKLATTQAHTATLLQSTLDKPSIDAFNILNIVNKDSWQQSYIQYLRFGSIPEEIEDKNKFRRRASFFTLLNNTLYRRGYSRPLLKCLDRPEADLVLSEAHEGICGIHSGARSLAQKILRAGFY
ncbi:uncharacterized protein LOC130956702 [Arachis stenosperma]|uniref:uncharacterized protein LOC130956702 n=1 Tax=Arachis stenosperma TaxID=217475 RepID=UPI0025ACE88F|nr:uncharacterized protein LOC130956702 [Arachis stenosperma]